MTAGSPSPTSEQTALALQAYQIFADNVLELSLLNLSTGEYRVIKRDPRLPVRVRTLRRTLPLTVSAW